MTELQAWILVVAAMASAAVGFVFGWLAISANRKIARQRATLDFLEKQTADWRIAEGFRAMRKRNAGDIPPADADDESSRQERYAILRVLNRFEILAIGIANGIYDEKIVWDYFQRDLREIYRAAEKIIEQIRRAEKDPDAFCEFEALAKRVKINANLAAR
jgi:hypothetical protein